MKIMMGFFGILVVWMLLACGGGGGGDDVSARVVYRDDGVLVVDGKAYTRRSAQEVKTVIEKEGGGRPAILGHLVVVSKVNLSADFVNAEFQAYGLKAVSVDRFDGLDGTWYYSPWVEVPPDWTDQWRRVFVDLPWVDSATFDFGSVPNLQR